MRYVIVDLDHTLSDAKWRDPLLPQNCGGSWDDYHRDQEQDGLIEVVADLVRSAAGWPNHQVVALTARPNKWRAATQRWIARHRLPIRELLMRPDGDLSRSGELKLRMIRFHFTNPEMIRLIVEDRADVVDLLRELGRPIFQVHT